jgi:hypothetical protein
MPWQTLRIRRGPARLISPAVAWLDGGQGGRPPAPLLLRRRGTPRWRAMVVPSRWRVIVATVTKCDSLREDYMRGQCA